MEVIKDVKAYKVRGKVFEYEQDAIDYASALYIVEAKTRFADKYNALEYAGGLISNGSEKLVDPHLLASWIIDNYELVSQLIVDVTAFNAR